MFESLLLTCLFFTIKEKLLASVNKTVKLDMFLIQTSNSLKQANRPKHSLYKGFLGKSCLPNLVYHRDSKHMKKVFQCSYCPFNTTWQQCLHGHMRAAHGYFRYKTKHNSERSEGQPILCDDCGFSTFNENQYQEHKEASCQTPVFKRIPGRIFKKE